MKGNASLDSEHLPLWFKLRPSFYHRLKRVAEEMGTSTAVALTESVKLTLKLSELANKANLSPTQLVTQFARFIRAKERSQRGVPDKPLVAYRWERTSSEQRSRIARNLARQRWEKRDERADPVS